MPDSIPDEDLENDNEDEKVIHISKDHTLV